MEGLMNINALNALADICRPPDDKDSDSEDDMVFVTGFWKVKGFHKPYN